MCVILIFITNFVLDAEDLYKIIGPFSSTQTAEEYIEENKNKIEEELKSARDHEEDDSWHYSVRMIAAP